MGFAIQIVSDFVCPYCYLLEAFVREISERIDLSVERIPFELTPPPQPRVDTYGDLLRRATYQETLTPVCVEIGLDMKLPPRVVPRPYTSLAFQGYLFARVQGAEDAYHARVFRAYFEEERDIGDPQVLTALAAECGLDPAAFQNALLHGDYAVQEETAVRYARETLAVRMVPTIFADGRRLEGFIRSARELEEWIRG